METKWKLDGYTNANFMISTEEAWSIDDLIIITIIIISSSSISISISIIISQDVHTANDVKAGIH